MLILQLFSRFPWPLKDGGALAFYNHLLGLKANGHTVIAAVLNTSKHSVNIDELPEEVKSLAEWHLININNEIKPLGALLNLANKESYILSRFQSELFTTLLQQLLKSHAFDAVIFESLQTAIYVNEVKQLCKAPCLLRSHNIEHQIWEEQALVEPNRFKRWYLRLQAKRLKKEELYLSGLMDGILAITKADQASYQQLGIQTPSIFYPVGFIAKNKSLPQAHQAKVFHLGSMDWMPNQVAVKYFLAEIWPLVIKEKKLRFEITGRNMPEAFHKIKQEGVVVMGEVADAATYMQENGLLVIPLKSGSGMRVKVMEGMALGKCIISTSKGMEGIEAQAGTHYILANTPEEFKNAILNLIANLDRADKIGAEARKFALEVYDNTKITANLNTFVKQLNKQA